MDQAEVLRLAEVAFKKRQVWESLRMLNTYNRSFDEKLDMAKEYALAEAEMLEADRKLREAQGRE